jgi:hypothetical protein
MRHKNMETCSLQLYMIYTSFSLTLFKIIFARNNGYCIFATALEASTPALKKAFQ